MFTNSLQRRSERPTPLTTPQAPQQHLRLYFPEAPHPNPQTRPRLNLLPRPAPRLPRHPLLPIIRPVRPDHSLPPNLPRNLCSDNSSQHLSTRPCRQHRPLRAATVPFQKFGAVKSVALGMPMTGRIVVDFLRSDFKRLVNLEHVVFDMKGWPAYMRDSEMTRKHIAFVAMTCIGEFLEVVFV